jgi:hypothetical protein
MVLDDEAGEGRQQSCYQVVAVHDDFRRHTEATMKIQWSLPKLSFRNGKMKYSMLQTAFLYGDYRLKLKVINATTVYQETMLQYVSWETRIASRKNFMVADSGATFHIRKDTTAMFDTREEKMHRDVWIMDHTQHQCRKTEGVREGLVCVSVFHNGALQVSDYLVR